MHTFSSAVLCGPTHTHEKQRHNEAIVSRGQARDGMSENGMRRMTENRYEDRRVQRWDYEGEDSSFTKMRCINCSVNKD